MSKRIKKYNGQHLITMPDEYWQTLTALAQSHGLSNSAMIRVLITEENKRGKPNE